MVPDILHESDNFFIIDKPSGWISNSSVTAGNQFVIQDWLRNNFDFSISKSVEYRSGLVHRLDKETSGVMIIAKNQMSFENLQSQFKDRIVQKTYLTLVHGLIDPGHGTIDAPVGRLPWRRDRFGVLPGGRNATTDYKVIGLYQLQNENYSLVEAYPKTGRTHQLRVHFKHIGHPIVSDKFYAGRKTARKDGLWCPRLFLHAHQISFNDPATSERTTLKSDLPKDLSQALEKLTQK